MKKLFGLLLVAASLGWGQITTIPGGGGGASLNTEQTLTNKTLDGVDAGAGTTRTAPNFLQIPSHNTDCTALTDGVARELCIEEDGNDLYKCAPSAGGCDTAAEWIPVLPLAPSESVFDSKPTCNLGNKGRAWFQDPDEGPLFGICDGTNWKYNGFGLSNLTLPSTSGWTTDYGSGADANPFVPTTTSGFIKLALPATSGTQIHIYRRDRPSDPTVTPYFVELCMTIPHGVVIAGAALFDDTADGPSDIDNGMIVTYNKTAAVTQILSIDYDLPTAATVSSAYFQVDTFTGRIACFGLREDATTRYTYEGTTPANLQLIGSVARTTNFTTTDLGVVLYTGNFGYPVEIDLFHYRVR